MLPHRPRAPHLRRAAAGALLALGTSIAVAAPSSASDDLPGWPSSAWSACNDDAQQYCIASATVTPVGGDVEPLAAAGLSAWVNPLDTDVSRSFNWAINGLDAASQDVQTGQFALTVRLGQFPPNYTFALAKGLRMDRSTDGSGNTTLVISGQATHIDWKFTDGMVSSCFSGLSCGDENTMADPSASGYRFSGNTQDMGAWDAESRDRFAGMYIATNAEARPTAILYSDYPQPNWMMSTLGNPHLDADGNPTRGSFNAWLPPNYFTSTGTDAATAASTGFDVMSTEHDADGAPVSIPATVSAQDGGVAIDVPDLAYSIHTISVFSRPSTATSGAYAPGSPTAVTATPGLGSLATRWTTPARNGSAAITRYTVRAFTAASGGAIAGSCSALTAAGCTIASLNPGTPYYLAVSATNAYGEGAPAARVAAAPVAMLPPAVPTALRVAPGAASLTATWTAPALSDGGPPTGYTVLAYSAMSGGAPVASCTTASTSCVLRGLVNGRAYFVSVAASNAAGTGLNSARVATMPRTVPTAPGGVLLSTGYGVVRATWSAPLSTGGAALTGYRASVYAAPSGGLAVTSCSTTAARTCLVPRLVVGRSYYVSVSATNAAGRSPESARVRVVVR